MKGRKFLQIFSIVLLVTSWEILTRVGIIPTLMLPSFSIVMDNFINQLLTGVLFKHLIYSLTRFVLGFAIAASIGIPLGIAMGWFITLRYCFDAIIEMLRPIPPIAWIPISLIWFGIGISSKAFIVFVGAFFPILLNTISGVKNIDKSLIEAAETLGAVNERTLISKVVMPGALPSILTGLRIGMGVGWMCIVAAEMVAANMGLGYMIIEARWIHNIPLVITYMIVIGITAFTLDRGFRLFEAWMLRWRREVRER